MVPTEKEIVHVKLNRLSNIKMILNIFTKIPSQNVKLSQLLNQSNLKEKKFEEDLIQFDLYPDQLQIVTPSVKPSTSAFANLTIASNVIAISNKIKILYIFFYYLVH